ncbi:uncharacterized protein LOC111305031 [Durio zibethinus]|uniref:Uncharacterized protein LOC111305031 n=1 Tax=Durio zibethinus TaxID=66656 RepID=A0A6P5ZZG9_DURZI|nr:uncharacterized protein LOC111305031 [Durio zibethinus]
MHQKISGEQLEIGKVSSDCITSDFNHTTSPLLFYSHQFNQNYIESTPQKSSDFSIPNKHHLTIQIPFSPTSPNASPPPSPPAPPSPPTTTTTHHYKKPNFQYHEPSFPNNPFPTHALLSTPHKRPMMTHNCRSHSPILPSFKNHHNHRKRVDRLASYSSLFQSFSCSTYFAVPFDTQELGRKLVHHLNRGRLLCIHLRFLVFLSLPSIYFLVSNPWRFFVLNLLALLAFSLTLLVSLNLALTRLPSIRLLLAHSLPSKFSQLGSSSISSKAVVWSIGSKPKSEKANSGTWVQLYSNGDAYEGEFHKGKCSGSGVYYYYMKGRYEGDWIHGEYDGYGVETWAKGSRYRGQYRQGLRHGIGVYRFYTGDVYAGEWSNGQFHGCGVQTCDDGSKYVGEFKWGVKHGLGHYHFRNGDIYFGEYFSDKMHGFGVYQFGNGHRYEGAWHEGRRQGFGTYTFKNGETQSGHWQDGVLDVLNAQNTHLGIPHAVTQSRVFNAVQEARQAAEKSYDIAKIDERVNKAVSAANKAANAARVVAVKAVQKQMHHHNSDNLPTSIA